MSNELVQRLHVLWYQCQDDMKAGKEFAALAKALRMAGTLASAEVVRSFKAAAAGWGDSDVIEEHASVVCAVLVARIRLEQLQGELLAPELFTALDAADKLLEPLASAQYILSDEEYYDDIQQGADGESFPHLWTSWRQRQEWSGKTAEFNEAFGLAMAAWRAEAS